MKQKKEKSLAIIVLLFLLSFLIVLLLAIYRIRILENRIGKSEKAPVKKEEVKNLHSQKKKDKEQEEIVVAENPVLSVDSQSVVVKPEENEKEEESKKEDLQDSGVISPKKKELTSVYIPLTKSVFGRTDAPENVFLTKPSLTQAEWENLKVAEVKTLASLKNIPLENLREGKLYYQGENGRMESFLYMDSKRKISEYLITYDPKGNSVDCLEVGCWIPETDEKKFANLSNNKLSVFELAPVKANGKREEIVTEYAITPALQFVRGKVFSKIF
ncbi:MAG: hypothetical protein FWF52_09930 [Candidatus Azobacteroides sp.]|nr:hypothetical protein [Candidatus Azobacteroides sp.]